MHSGIFPCATFRNCQAKAITKVLMSIYLPPQSSDVTHLPTECLQKQENTHLGPNPYFLLVENNYRSDRLVRPSYHTITTCSSLSGLTFELDGAMCAFSEVRPACVRCHTEWLRERWWPAHHAPLKALISVARHPPRGRAAISTIWSAGQLEFGAQALSDEWIISSHLSLKTVSKGWIVKNNKYSQGCEGRGKRRRTAVMNIWKSPSGRNMLRERKWIYVACLQRFLFVLGLMEAYRHYFK